MTTKFKKKKVLFFVTQVFPAYNNTHTTIYIKSFHISLKRKIQTMKKNEENYVRFGSDS